MKMEPLQILLVDDEEELVSALVERLALRGIDAEAVTRGSDAVDRVREKRFDVVVLDVKLPDMDGLEVLRLIKELRPAVPVVLFTGHGAVGRTEPAMPDQASDYLAKPIDIEDFVDKIRAAATDDVPSEG
jgi:DNA-binding NtrC family response regulator